MLKLSHKGLYGIKALYELSRRYGEGPVAIRDISESHDMPVPFLEQVLNHLKRSGLVKSRRGVNGGYTLARDPREITIGDAVRALEGPIALCDCLQHQETGKPARKATSCVTFELYQKLGDMLETTLDSITLFQLASEYRNPSPGESCRCTQAEETTS